MTNNTMSKVTATLCAAAGLALVPLAGHAQAPRPTTLAGRSTVYAPNGVPFGGYRLWELAPNSEGVAALEMLRLLEGTDLKAMGHNSPAYLHHLIEAKKIAYADIEHDVGDPAAMTVAIDRFLSGACIRERRLLIDPSRAMERADPGRAATASDTICLAAADKDGNMVSFITSVYDYFGSGIVVPGTGILLHDRGVGFTMAEGRAITVAPRKRPFHTIIPAFVTRTTRRAGVLRDASGDEPYLAFGVIGGAMQPQGTCRCCSTCSCSGWTRNRHPTPRASATWPGAGLRSRLRSATR
jgi:gamma-glutamyltranspeptidase/glutathione hydrolase